MDTRAAASSWDAEYASGRYRHEPPAGFARDIVDAARSRNLRRGLYIGCGNGRNFIPMSDAGLDLIGLDISARAIAQLRQRRPSPAGLIVGDLGAVLPSARFELVIGIQVFQHGRRDQAHRHLTRAAARVGPGGLLCVRVNATETDVRHQHERTETAGDGSFTIRYRSGPKTGLDIHFFTAAELERLTGDGFTAVLPPRLDSTPHATRPRPVVAVGSDLAAARARLTHRTATIRAGHGHKIRLAAVTRITTLAGVLRRFDTIRTARLVMRRWRDADRDAFAAMNADPVVMRYFPATLDRAASDAYVDKIESLFGRQGFGLWALEVAGTADFIGFTGLNPMPPGVPGEGGMEVGWRLAERAWHQGYATEAAAAAVDVAFDGAGLDELWSVTAVLNEPSQAVMRRLGMTPYARFEHPRVAVGHPVRPHVAYRLQRARPGPHPRRHRDPRH